MTSKVLVKLPVVPFQQQRKKPPPEIAPLPSSRNADECSSGDEGRFQGYTSDKVTQLEQNIKYLQDQHQTTLVSLHQEVELLRQRNRDLQFQLVFTKGTNYASSSPSSPEDNGNGFVKAKQQGSPTNVNVAPLQVELLEKELQDLRASLSEAKTRNICLSEAVEKQKQKLELNEKSKEKQKDIGIQVDSFIECREVELQARLDDAEALVKRLRLESDEQRKEIANLKSNSGNSYGNNYNNSGQSNNSGQQRGGGGQSRSQSSYHSSGRGSAASNELQSNQDDTYHKFPPLHTQSYWHRGSARSSHSYESKAGQSDYRRNNRHQQQHHQQQQQHHQQQQLRPEVLEVDDGAGMLPQLHNGGNLCFDASASYPPPFYRQQTHHNGGNYHRDEQQQQAGNFRKYRGKKPRKDFNGQDRRVFQYEQNPTTPPKDHHPQQQQQQRVPFVPDSRPAPRRHQS